MTFFFKLMAYLCGRLLILLSMGGAFSVDKMKSGSSFEVKDGRGGSSASILASSSSSLTFKISLKLSLFDI